MVLTRVPKYEKVWSATHKVAAPLPRPSIPDAAKYFPPYYRHSLSKKKIWMWY